MHPDAIHGILELVACEHGKRGYSIERFLPAGDGGAVAIIVHVDGSRFVVMSDRHGDAARVPDGSQFESEILAGALTH